MKKLEPKPAYRCVNCGELYTAEIELCEECKESESIFPVDPPKLVEGAIVHLERARELLKLAGAKRTLARVRSAISSAKGAERHADSMRHRAERRAV